MKKPFGKFLKLKVILKSNKTFFFFNEEKSFFLPIFFFLNRFVDWLIDLDVFHYKIYLNRLVYFSRIKE